MFIYSVWLLVLNPVTFLFYWFDKNQARNGGQRVPESVLLNLSLLGGFVGGWLAMHLVRHKTRRFTFWAMQGVGLFICVGVFWWLSGGGG